MKKTMLVMAAILLGGLFARYTTADTGYEGATRIERGAYVDTRSVTVSPTAATLVFPPSKKRPDSVCKNFSSYTIYLGTAAAGTTLSGTGLPIGASEYFKLDGSLTGAIYALAEPGASNVQFRCMDGMSYQ